MFHYHICWSTKEVLDWEAFDSREEAEASAQQLVRLGETYTIVERDEDCPRCWKAFTLKTSHDAKSEQNGKYPWQQAVLDALAEMRSEIRIRKVNAAQRAISARLADTIDMNEQAAIRDALQALRALLPERTDPKSKPSEKKEIA